MLVCGYVGVRARAQHACVNSSVHIETRRPLRSLTLSFETGSLHEPGAQDFSHPDWPASLQDPPVSAFPSPWL